MPWINYFFPRRVHFPDSKFNKEIVVLDYGNSATLFSENLIESGPIMTQIWGAGLRRLLPTTFIPQTILLLGLGGGSNALLVARKFPQAKITGVDIDPVMVDIGRKFFGLSRLRNLKIVVADATAYVDHLGSADRFDLILLDCFAGQNFPKKLENLGFLQKLKNHGRYVLINHLWWHGYRSKTLAFMRSLSTRFFFIKTHTRTNTIISLV